MIEGTFEPGIVVKNELSAQSNGNNIAIIGVNRIGHTLLRRAGHFMSPPRRIVGFISEHSSNELRFQGSNHSSSFPNILGTIDSLPDIVRENQISHLIVAIHPADVHKIHNAIRNCEKAKTEYHVVSVTYDYVCVRIFKEIARRLSSLPKLDFRFFLDFIFAFVTMLLLFPSFLLISLLIKLESKGSVLYSEERVGQQGKIFNMYRFRTFYLRENNDSLSSLSSDVEYTRLGRFLRRFYLDDLPKLFNVMLGDLSFIGPRPDEPYFFEKFSREIPFYQNRVKVRPGLISLAQIETHDDNLIEDVREKLKYDLFYVDHQNSLLLNLKILLKSNLLIFHTKFS